MFFTECEGKIFLDVCIQLPSNFKNGDEEPFPFAFKRKGLNCFNTCVFKNLAIFSIEAIVQNLGKRSFNSISKTLHPEFIQMNCEIKLCFHGGINVHIYLCPFGPFNFLN